MDCFNLEQDKEIDLSQRDLRDESDKKQFGKPGENDGRPSEFLVRGRLPTLKRSWNTQAADIGRTCLQPCAGSRSGRAIKTSCCSGKP